MSAQKRKKPQPTVWLQPRISRRAPATFQTKVLAYPGAKGALRKLSDAGFREDLLWRHLWGLAWLKKAPGGQTSQWYALPATPSHTLRRFPGRVRRLAKEIKSVDAKLRSGTEYTLTVQFLPVFLAGAIPGAKVELRGKGNVIREVGTGKHAVPATLARSVLQRHALLPKLAELPELLRFYADYIEAVSRLTAHHASKAPALLSAMMPLQVIEAAKRLTGKLHANEIATLLEAAYFAVGVNETVDPRNLKMQRWRRVSRKK